MSKQATEEQTELAREIFGNEQETRYMLLGTGLRHDLTLKLLDVILEERQKRRELQQDRDYWRRMVPIRELGGHES